MLRYTQGLASDDNHHHQNLVGNNNDVDMSVLERQRAIFQRLYHHHHSLHNMMIINENTNHNKESLKMDAHHHQYYDNSHLQNLSSSYGGESFGLAPSSDVINGSHHFEMDNRSHATISNSISSLSPPMPKAAAAAPARRESKTSAKKRKAEFDIEEDAGRSEKENEGEAQSEVTAVKSERENSNENSKASKVKKPDYIHVRARRGQATDSHSLAERARREKISKKMKYLQELVPGCNKVTGKAGMLDEIINYVQSLQKQVEFLSMKLAALNPRLDFNVDNNLFAKELPAYVASFPSGGVDIMNATTQMTIAMMPPEVFLTAAQPTWESEWQSPYNNNNLNNFH